MAITLGPRARKVLRYVAIGVAAIIVFVFALQLTFPYGRIRDKLVERLSAKYDVSIGAVDRGWMPGRVYFKAVSLRSRPEKAGEPVTTFYIDQLELDVGLLSLLHKTASLDFDAKIDSGRLKGNVTLPGFGKKGLELELDGRDLPGESLPMRMVLGLPMTGKLDLAFALDLPNEVSKSGRTTADWKHAEGSATFACPHGCTFGDGKTRLKPLLKNSRQQVMVGDGIEFGKVNIDSLVAKATIHKGELEVTKFETKSKDGELHVDFKMTFAPVLGNSIVDGCLRFNGSQALLKREPKTYTAITATGAELRSDGLFHIKLMGEVKEMRRLNLECGPDAAEHHHAPLGGAHPRPHITIQPDAPVHTPPGAAHTPPAINPPPPAAAAPARGIRPPPRAAEGEPVGSGSAGEGAGSGEPSSGDEPSSGEVAPGAGTAGAGGAGEPVR